MSTKTFEQYHSKKSSDSLKTLAFRLQYAILRQSPVLKQKKEFIVVVSVLELRSSGHVEVKAEKHRPVARWRLRHAANAAFGRSENSFMSQNCCKDQHAKPW